MSPRLREPGGMRITVAGGLLASASPVDADVVAGATVAEILNALGASASIAWCGRERLTADHRAGIYPLVHGAVLSEVRGHACAPPHGPHLAVIAGPDAGMVADCSDTVTIGRAADLSIADNSMSRLHAIARASAGTIVVRDVGSTNGITPASDPRTREGASPSARSLADPHRVMLLGETWIAVRSGPGAPRESASGANGTAHAAGPDERTASPRRLAAMTGAGASAVVLAAVTGRWYLALLALIYPVITFGPELVRRLRPQRVAPLSGLPDPTTSGSTDARRSVAITGEPELRAATARAEILARGRRPPSHAHGLAEPWLNWLPPAVPGDGDLIVVDSAPSWCDRELSATRDATEVRERGQPVLRSAPVRVAESTAEWAARRIAGSAHRGELPTEVRWADLPAPSLPTGGARRLRVSLGLVATGNGTEPWVLDLDADGPHVLVAGTTGSGKSALLRTFVLALAASHAPCDVEFALMDFKGGAALAPCAALPHVVGVVTDLDGRQARRALTAVGAALAERKVHLSATEHSSYAEWEACGDAPPRMVVVVDEFQEIGALHRDFVPELTRLAAQGRSLGMHLVLATQRPSGAVTPEIRANVSTTIALRVASDAESRDLVGTAEAALLPTEIPGRAIVASAGTRSMVHVALPTATPSERVRRAAAPPPPPGTDLVEWVLNRHQDEAHAPLLWHPPLPERIHHDDLTCAQNLISVGLADWPVRRERSTLRWDPRSGPLALAGPPGEARTALLDAVAAGAARAGYRPVRLPEDPREAARTVWLAESAPGSMLIVDDVATALVALARVDRGAPADLLVARAARSAPMAFALGAGTHHRIASHAAVRLIMAGLAPQDDALWGVPRELADIPTHPRAVRAWSAQGWCEARMAEPEVTPFEQLVARLPSRTDAAPPAGVVGIGGDHAQLLRVEPGQTCAVVGSAGRERDDVVALLVAAQAGPVEVAEAPMFLSPGAREGLVVATAPTPRIAQELCRDGALGLVDDHPGRGRVLWVNAGTGACAQLGLDSLVRDPVEHVTARSFGE